MKIPETLISVENYQVLSYCFKILTGRELPVIFASIFLSTEAFKLHKLFRYRTSYNLKDYSLSDDEKKSFTFKMVALGQVLYPSCEVLGSYKFDRLPDVPGDFYLKVKNQFEINDLFFEDDSRMPFLIEQFGEKIIDEINRFKTLGLDGVEEFMIEQDFLNHKNFNSLMNYANRKSFSKIVTYEFLFSDNTYYDLYDELDLKILFSRDDLFLSDLEKFKLYMTMQKWDDMPRSDELYDISVRNDHRRWFMYLFIDKNKLLEYFDLDIIMYIHKYLDFEIKLSDLDWYVLSSNPRLFSENVGKLRFLNYWKWSVVKNLPVQFSDELLVNIFFSLSRDNLVEFKRFISKNKYISTSERVFDKRFSMMWDWKCLIMRPSLLEESLRRNEVFFIEKVLRDCHNEIKNRNFFEKAYFQLYGIKNF